MTAARRFLSRADDVEGGGLLAMMIGGVLSLGLTLAVGLTILGVGLSDRREVAAGSTALSAADVDGEAVYATRCAKCHGDAGEGGIGPQLAGTLVEKYPEIADQIAVVTNGRAGMPSFGGGLTTAEIEAVVLFERTGLGT